MMSVLPVATDSGQESLDPLIRFAALGRAALGFADV
jgi:hypothetical protein